MSIQKRDNGFEGKIQNYILIFQRANIFSLWNINYVVVSSMILWWITSSEKKKQSKGNVNEFLEKTIERKDEEMPLFTLGFMHFACWCLHDTVQRWERIHAIYAIFSSIFAILPPAKITYLSHAHFLLPGKTSTGSHQSGFIKIQVRQTQSLNTDIHIIFKNIFFL